MVRQVLLPIILLLPVLQAQITDPASYVLPLIGTLAPGHVFPGATLPHGMVKVGLDTDSPDGQAGYDNNAKYHATGFSQLHDSGTGGGFSLSNFKVWPQANCSSFSTCPTGITPRKILRQVLSDGSPDDFASPGYFASNLSSLIRAELTASRRTALHKYSFPLDTTQPRILVDVTNDGGNSAQRPTVLINPDSGRISGGANFAPSFGTGRYDAFFCADFRGFGYDAGSPTEYGVYTDNNPVQGTTTTPSGSFSEMGALLTFSKNPSGGSTAILVRVGVSLISSSQACANAESEIPDFDFDQIHQENRGQWNELLGRIQVEPDSVPRDTVELFYSSVYRTHISPADYTGENPRWTSTEPYYDSFYCNVRDTYRTLYSLMSLHDPIRFADITRSLIDIQRNEGWMPECRGSTDMQWIQGGSNADPIVGEFFVKFHEQAQSLGVSADDLYTALLADAEKEPPDWDFQGRQANVYNQFDYLPWDIVVDGRLNTRQVSRTLEYSYDDFSIAQVAKILGKTDDAAKYFKRAANFLNVWNPETVVPDNTSIVGMMQPKYQNGSFGYTDPRHCSIHDPDHSTCFLTGDAKDGFYEGSPLIYSQYVPQDHAKLIELQGGNDKFITRLDFIFDQGYYEPGDEPSQQMPFQYTYADRPGLSTRRSRQVMTSFYNSSNDGLPGNDDSGAMGSYAAFFMLGLYPVPATRQYLLSSPYFKEVSFFNPLYKTTTRIVANGFSGNPPDGTGNVFVKSVTVNGEQYKTNCYLEWEVFTAESTVELTLTDDITLSCGTGPGALPPSLSTGGFN